MWWSGEGERERDRGWRYRKDAKEKDRIFQKGNKLERGKLERVNKEEN